MAIEPLTDPLQLPANGDLAEVIRMLNRHHRVLVERINQLEGTAGKTPTIHNAPNYMGNRLESVGRSQQRSDAITRGEIEDLLGDLRGPTLQVQRPLVAAAGLRAPGGAVESSGLVSLAQLYSVIAALTASINEAFVTIGNSPTLGLERALAVTAGDLVMADGGANAAVTLSLANIIVAGGPVGDSMHVPVITWDAHGRLTVVSSVALAAGAGANFAGCETPGGGPTNFTLANAPIATPILVRNGSVMKTGAAATVEEFQIAGVNITLGAALGGGEWLRAWYPY